MHKINKWINQMWDTSESMFITSFINQSFYEIITSIAYLRVSTLFLYVHLKQYHFLFLSFFLCLCTTSFCIFRPIIVVNVSNQLHHILFIIHISRVGQSRMKTTEKRRKESVLRRLYIKKRVAEWLADERMSATANFLFLWINKRRRAYTEFIFTLYI